MENIDAIFEGLNDEQKQAVSCVEGPVLIVAGAGSGKTRVLTSRVANILAQGTDPARILALTFTKKAAGEMKERIAGMVGERRARRVVMGTFHAVFVRFLREFADSLGYPQQFTIYDTSDSTSAIKACIKELGLDDKIYKPKDVLSRISMAKNNLVTVNAYRNNPNLLMADSHAKKPRICDLYALYQQKMKQSGVMDFDDILLNMNYLLRDNPAALESIAGRFSYIMVDEYQDTNYAQYIIMKKLSAKHRNICVVGDDSQSIYAFRGAKIENILNFKKDYPDCRLFRLERNYRSTSTIVDAANSVIAHNQGRIPKECYAVGRQGELIRIIKAYSEQEEAMEIVSAILSRMRSDSAQYQDFAILYRTNAQSRALEEQLRRRNIPYMIYSGNSFFERAEVKDLMAYFKLCVNPNDDESFRRVVNKPARGIGDTTVAAVESAARQAGTSFFTAGFGVPKVKPFCEKIQSLSKLVSCTDAHELATKIADESGLTAYYKADTSIEGLARLANFEELVNSVEAFVEERFNEMDDEFADSNAIFTLDDFLENVTLLSNVDVTEDNGETNNKVALMTVHSAKGLEFDYVFIAGLEENLFPSVTPMSPTSEVEEERRLFYVAVTRARKTVSLSFAGTRMRNGKHESNSPSRFLKEIDSRFLENPLEDEDFDNTGLTHEWGGFGSRFTGGRMNRYGQSGPAVSQRSGREGDRQPSFGSRPSWAAQASGRTSSPAVTVRGAGNTGAEHEGVRAQSRAASQLPPKPAVIDPDFVGVPQTELRVGERIEHNRFGAGVILELSGRAPEMKARIDFDAYGEKLLLLKYAKIRPEKH